MSKKFQLITFSISDGHNQYLEHTSFHTSDVQKMSDMEMIAHYFEGNSSVNLEALDKESEEFWLSDKERAVQIVRWHAIGLSNHDLLQKFCILNGKPPLLKKNKNNIVQLITKQELKAR